jgi:hypothetical protein
MAVFQICRTLRPCATSSKMYVLDRTITHFYHRRIVPLAVEYDKTRHWVIVRATGFVTLADILTLIQTARADVEHRMWPMLFDARGATTNATEVEVNTAVLTVQRAVREQGPRGHVALVADDDRFYDRMLLYEARCAEIGVRVIRAFRDAPDAARWLEIVSAARYFR